MNSAKWTCIAIGYQTLYAYAASFVVYQLGLVAWGHAFNMLSALAAAIVIGAAYMIFRPVVEKDRIPAYAGAGSARA